MDSSQCSGVPVDLPGMDTLNALEVVTSFSFTNIEKNAMISCACVCVCVCVSEGGGGGGGVWF